MTTNLFAFTAVEVGHDINYIHPSVIYLSVGLVAADSASNRGWQYLESYQRL